MSSSIENFRVMESTKAYLETEHGDIISFKCFLQGTILEAKTVIQKKMGIDPKYQVLFYEKTELKNEKKLADYNIFYPIEKHFRLITEIPHPPGDPVCLFIRNFKTQQLNTSLAIPADDYKILVYKITKVMPRYQYLRVHGHSPLHGTRAIEDFGARRESTIELTVRPCLPGCPYKINHQTFIENIPSWRTITRGFNVEAICDNNGCAAKGRRVWKQYGMGEFSLNDILEITSCPKCKKTASKIDTFGFFDCTYSYKGLHEGCSADPVEYKGGNQAPSDKLEVFKNTVKPNQKNGNWIFLRFIVIPNSNNWCQIL